MTAEPSDNSVFNSYPYNIPVGFSFKVVFQDNKNIMKDGKECMFQEVSGINASFDTETIAEGGVNNYLHKLPKAVKYDNLVLKRGLYRGSSLITWATDAINNFKFTPIPVEISLLDHTAAKILTWTFNNVYPVSLKISEFKSIDNAIVVESLELAYSFLTGR